MSDLKPTLKQIELYKELRKITEPHHMYADQIMAIAEYIDAEFIHKSKANGVNTSDMQLTIPDVSGSYKIGDKIVVCEELFTTIHHFDGDMVWFYDPYVEKLRYSNISEIQHDDGTF